MTIGPMDCDPGAALCAGGESGFTRSAWAGYSADLGRHDGDGAGAQRERGACFYHTGRGQSGCGLSFFADVLQSWWAGVQRRLDQGGVNGPAGLATLEYLVSMKDQGFMPPAEVDEILLEY